MTGDPLPARYWPTRKGWLAALRYQGYDFFYVTDSPRPGSGSAPGPVPAARPADAAGPRGPRAEDGAS